MANGVLMSIIIRKYASAHDITLQKMFFFFKNQAFTGMNDTHACIHILQM